MGLFGGGGEAKMKVTKYYLSIHMGVCQGPVDAVKRVWVGEKLAWRGVWTRSGTTALLRDGLFGGLKKEGGVAGSIDVLIGNREQLPSPMLIKKLRRDAGNVPAFRGITSLLFYGGGEVWPDMTNLKPDDTDTGGLFGGVRGVFSIFAFFSKKSFYWGTQPYIKPVWVTVQRIPARQLRPDTAPIPRGVSEPLALYLAIDISNSMAEITSNGKTRLENMKTALEQALLPLTAYTTATSLDIRVVAFAKSSVSIQRDNVNGQDVRDIIDWIKARDQSDVANGNTDFELAVSSAPAFFDGRPNKERVLAFITDGEPYISGQPLPTEQNAIDAGNVIDSVSMLSSYGFNIDLEDTQYTAYVDNTPGDGVPVVPGGDPSVLANSLGYVFSPVADANPAHIVYECLTDTDWGMGADPASLDTASFEAASQVLYAEQFGVFMTWMQQSSIEDFIGDVLDHIKGALYPHPRTGKITLRLLRDDLDHDTLKEITPDNAVLGNFSRKGWGETTNEIVVTWTNPDTEKGETVRAQDLANLAQQGQLVSGSKNYYGVRTPQLALRLAERDLREASAPLASCEVEVGPEFWDTVPFDGVKVTWPEFGLDGLVMRVMKVNYGDSGSRKIRLSLVEDLFALPLASYVPPQQGEWEDPTAPPAPVSHAWMIPFPLYFLDLVGGTVNDLTHPETGVVVLAANPTTDESATFDVLWKGTTASDDTAWEWVQTDRPFLGRATLTVELPAAVTSPDVGLEDLTGWWVHRDDIVLFGDSSLAPDELEMALVTAVDEETGAPTLLRGVLDTAPRTWPAGTPVWFTNREMWRPLPKDLNDGDTFTLKLLVTTGEGQLDESLAPEIAGTGAARPTLPYRPADLRAQGFLWPAEDYYPDYPVDVEWLERNRLTETGAMRAWDAAGVAPESGTDYRVTAEAIDETGAVAGVIEEVVTGGLTSYTLDDATVGETWAGYPFIRVSVAALRDGLASWQAGQVTFRGPFREPTGLVGVYASPKPPQDVSFDLIP
ncbi:phage tail protein [Halomonas alimentaria]|uniref:VWA domain-containing protein n=1 Tax=Halomonas alimentaria TaxID=147248 RepID=A0A7X4W2M0_9GAMM|nr:phage tail protein [Halomonas alimentaria]NAW33252.1 VWA domain-containing protein [Halomonas alimentaria]